MGYTYEQLQQMGAKPVEEPTAPTNKKKYTFEELQAMGAKPVEQKQDGMLATAAKSVATPFARMGVNAYNAAQGVGALMQGKPFTAEDAAQSRTLPFLGEVKPVGQEGTFPEKVKESIGVGSEIASNFVPVGRVASVIKPGLKGLIGQTIKEGAKTGLAGGSIYGFGTGLQDPNATVGSVAGETALGGVVGGLGGGLLSGVGAAASKALQGPRKVLSEQEAQKVAGLVSSKVPTAEQTRTIAELTKPKLTLKEKAIGLTPDVKKRIQGKPELTKEYIDVVNARNLDDRLPSGYGHAATYVDKAQDILEKKLNDTGGDIGKFRRKIGTYSANIDDINDIENAFVKEINKLNLLVDKNGAITKNASRISQTTSDAEIKAVQELYNDFQVVKQSPTLENLIDMRRKFDKKIKFGKEAREISNMVDPLSKAVRTSIAEKAAKLVGKTEAKNLNDYSEYIDALEELKSYTDRRAGSEYLLKLALSGRGAESQKIIQRIKQETGIDLMDHATLAKLTTDTFANQSQKDLFRQEITKAGLDAASLMRGDVKGLLGSIASRGIDALTDPEEIILNASKSVGTPRVR